MYKIPLYIRHEFNNLIIFYGPYKSDILLFELQTTVVVTIAVILETINNIADNATTVVKVQGRRMNHQTKNVKKLRRRRKENWSHTQILPTLIFKVFQKVDDGKTIGLFLRLLLLGYCFGGIGMCGCLVVYVLAGVVTISSNCNVASFNLLNRLRNELCRAV